MIGAIIVGILAGIIASKIMGDDDHGCLIDLLIGLLGGVVGGWVFDLLGLSWGGLLGQIGTATVGAVLLLWIYAKIKK